MWKICLTESIRPTGKDKKEDNKKSNRHKVTVVIISDIIKKITIEFEKFICNFLWLYFPKSNAKNLWILDISEFEIKLENKTTPLTNEKIP